MRTHELVLAAFCAYLSGCRPNAPRLSNLPEESADGSTDSLAATVEAISSQSLDHAVWDTADGVGVYCEDTSRYSMEFVRCLRGMSLGSLLRIENGLIIGVGPEPIVIAPVLPDTKRHRFQDEDGISELVVRRKNLTSIEVAYHSVAHDGEAIAFRGTCHLGCGFILGAESDDGEEGAYFVDEYWSPDECFSFRIGMDGTKLRATATGSCLTEANGFLGNPMVSVE